MFIQTEETPNPNSLKFLPGRVVLAGQTAMFTEAEACHNSPIARRLLMIPEVTQVFFGEDFITISKDSAGDWYALKPAILGIIMEHFVANLPVLETLKEAEDVPGPAPQEETDPIVRQIQELIDTRVRPAVAQDGGDIVFHDFRDGIVYLRMHGACSGCPSATATLKSGIENMLKYYVPEVLEVQALN